MAKLTRQRLRIMRERWERDLAVLEDAFAGIDLAIMDSPESETIRNLATAVATIDGIITNRLPLNSRNTDDEASRTALATEGCGR